MYNTYISTYPYIHIHTQKLEWEKYGKRYMYFIP